MLMFILWPCSSTFWREHAEQYRAVPSWTVLAFALQAFKHSCDSEPQWTTVVPLEYALHPTPECDTLHTNGARFGFAVRRSLWHGIVRFGMLWSTSEVVHRGMLPVRFGTCTVCQRHIQAPLWRSTALVWHALRECFNALYITMILKTYSLTSIVEASF